MSPLSSERLLIGLARAQEALERSSGFLRPKLVEQKTIACDPAFGAEPWQGAVSALQSLQIEAAARASVVLSNQFARYAIVPWSEALGTAAEEEAYVRHHFAKIHGERAKGWAVRASESARGTPRLASAIDQALLDAIKACFAKSRARLVSVQPELMYRLNAWREAIPASGAWVVIAEPDRACVALHSGGQWRAVQNAKGAWRALLDRERHRVDAEVPNLVLLAGARAPAEESEWKFRELAA